MWTLVRGLAAAAALASGVFATWAFLAHWDPTRLVWKRSGAGDPYKYEEIHPRFLETDPASLVTIRGSADVERVRDRLAALLWEDGRLPLDRRPDAVETLYRAEDWSVLDRFALDCPSIISRTLYSTVCLTDLYGGMANLARIDRLRIPDGMGYVALAAHFRPARGNGRLVILQQGLAGTYHDQVGHIRTLIAEGYAVIAFNQPDYGDFEGRPQAFETAALRMFVEPVVVAVSYGLETLGYEHVDMIGFSAGAWVTVLVAAADVRIRHSYPVAGVLPVYLRRDRETAPPQLDPRLLATVSYPDLFVLGAAGRGRAQVQIFNRFDRCCFAGRRGRLYEASIRDTMSVIGAGRFEVLIDETHARHKISQFAMRAILDDMAR